MRHRCKQVAFGAAVFAPAAVLACCVIGAIGCSPRHPFTSVCSGELGVVSSTRNVRDERTQSSVVVPGGPGRIGFITSEPLGAFTLLRFPYGHDPTLWFTELTLSSRCNDRPDVVSLGLVNEGVVYLRGGHRQFVEVIEKDGSTPIVLEVKSLRPHHRWAPSREGFGFLLAAAFVLAGMALGWRARRWSKVIAWPKGVVGDDGMLHTANARVLLACSCKHHPGRPLFFQPAHSDGGGPYREHGVGRLSHHVAMSELGARWRLRLLTLAMGFFAAVAISLSIAAFYAAATGT